MSKQSKGCCIFCGKEYAKAGMGKHLKTCSARMDITASSDKSEKKAEYFNLVIEGSYLKSYWLIIDIRKDSTLKDLDQFLRNIWLECCGHLSAFNIEGESYDVAPSAMSAWGVKTKGMNARLSNVLRKGMVFYHEYDFGTPTELTLKVLDERVGPCQKNKVIILSRNNPVEIMCQTCGENVAVVGCAECIYDNTGYLCKECAIDHECGEDMQMVICNSPRSCVCGYEGDE